MLFHEKPDDITLSRYTGTNKNTANIPQDNTKAKLFFYVGRGGYSAVKFGISIIICIIIIFAFKMWGVNIVLRFMLL